MFKIKVMTAFVFCMLIANMTFGAENQIFAFEKQSKVIKVNDLYAAEFSDLWKTDGEKSLKISFKKYNKGEDQWPGVSVSTAKPYAPLSKESSIAVDVFNPQDEAVKFYITLWDAKSKMYTEKFMLKAKSASTISFELTDLSDFACKNISRIKLYTARPEKAYSVYVDNLRYIIDNKTSEKEKQRGYVLFNLSTLESMSNDYVPSRKSIASEVSCDMARGEYKSLQFGVHALRDLKNIKVTVSSDIDVKIYHRRDIYVNPGAEMNGEWELEHLQLGDTVSELEAGASVNYWLTFHADTNTPPGAHHGRILVEVQDTSAEQLDLTVQVRPFQLADARIPFGMYDFELRHKIPRPDRRVVEQYRNMAEHSHNSSTFYAWDREALVKRVAQAQEGGLIQKEIPCILESSRLKAQKPGTFIPLLSVDELNTEVEWMQKQHKDNGWPELLVYTIDEPAYELPKLEKAFAPLRKLDSPSRLTTAMSSAAVYSHGNTHDVWIVHDGHSWPGMQEEAKRRGAQVWTYSYRIWRQNHSPLQQRYYAGFYTWANKLSGNFVWVYYHCPPGRADQADAMNMVWWDDPVTGEDMPTTGWEARREGIDDYRYLQMVEDAIKVNQGNPLAVEAAVWLEEVRALLLSNARQDKAFFSPVNPDYHLNASIQPHIVEAGNPLKVEDYEAIRAKAAGYIEKLGPATADQLEYPTVNYLKDEAAGFRGLTVEQCIEGLDSNDVSTQRAAAWALFEMGSGASPAVPKLMEALDDPDTVVPALRALESIGPDALQAKPKVATFLTSPNNFVRLGANRTLAAISGDTKPLYIHH